MRSFATPGSRMSFGPIPLDVLSRFDQYHYDGVAAVEEGIARLALAPHHRALDVGSGLGGPARIIADRAGCAVTALELQPDVHEVAARLTARAGLADLVSHRQGDILEGAPEAGGFDALFAWLVFLHIPDRARLYRRCFEALRPGGAMYVEDYFERGTLTDAERGTLADKVYCRDLPRLEELRRDLAGAGFAEVEIEDVTAFWTGMSRSARGPGVPAASARQRSTARRSSRGSTTSIPASPPSSRAAISAA